MIQSQGPNGLIPVETIHIASNQVLVHRVLEIEFLPTHQVKNKLLHHNIYKNSTIICGSNWGANLNLCNIMNMCVLRNRLLTSR